MRYQMKYQKEWTHIQKILDTIKNATVATDTIANLFCKIDNEFYKGRYMFTVDFTDSDISDCPAQHKQNHVIQLIDAGKWTGNIVALPNNRVRVTSPALWVTGEGAPDFRPSQHIHAAEIHDSYTDPEITFNNLYKENKNGRNEK